MIRRVEYAWEDIKVILPGSVIPDDGVVALDYEYKKDHSNIYARGAKPMAAGRGKEEPSGSMTLLQSTVEAMLAALPPGKNLTHIAPFTLTVSYAPEGGIAVTDQLIGVRIASFKKGMKTGDGNMTVDCSLVIADILYNI